MTPTHCRTLSSRHALNLKPMLIKTISAPSRITCSVWRVGRGRREGFSANTACIECKVTQNKLIHFKFWGSLECTRLFYCRGGIYCPLFISSSTLNGVSFFVTQLERVLICSYNRPARSREDKGVSGKSPARQEFPSHSSPSTGCSPVRESASPEG